MLNVFCFVSGKLVRRSQDRLLILLVRPVCLTPHTSTLTGISDLQLILSSEASLTLQSFPS